MSFSAFPSERSTRCKEVEPVGRIDRVAVHDMERIVARELVQFRQRSPRAADGIESLVAQPPDLLGRPLQRLADDALGFLQRSAADVLQREAAKRHGDAFADRHAAHLDKFEAAAAHVADDAVRLVETRNDAEGGKLRLPRAGKQLDRRGRGSGRGVEECGAVRRVPRGRRCEHEDIFGPHRLCTGRGSAQAPRSAFSTASSSRRPVVATCRPRPQSTFSL